MLVDPGFGIEQATLTASWVEALTERQTIGRHLPGARCRSRMSASSSIRLSVRLGPNRVFRLAPVESDMPERSVAARLCARTRQRRGMAGGSAAPGASV